MKNFAEVKKFYILTMMISRLIRIGRLFISLIIICVMRLLSPFFLLRLAPISSQRIGHLALDVEITLNNIKKDRKNRLFPIHFNLFLYIDQVANEYLLKLWKNKITFSKSRTLHSVAFANKKLPDGSKFNLVSSEDYPHHDLRFLGKNPISLEIPKCDEEIAWTELSKLGVNPDSKIVCFCVRDESYLKNTFPNNDWSYHNIRDSTISHYLEAAEALSERGYFVFRMGKIVSDGFISNNSKIIDYANSEIRSDFLDIFLLSNAKFTISSGTGMDAVSAIFRRPIGYINISHAIGIPLGCTTCLYQPKYFKDVSSGKYLDLTELLQRGWRQRYTFEDFESIGIEVEENSSQEIKEFCIEVEEKITKDFLSRNEDDKILNLQNKLSLTWNKNLLLRNR